MPALALGQLVGVLFVEDARGERFSHADAATSDGRRVDRRQLDRDAAIGGAHRRRGRGRRIAGRRSRSDCRDLRVRHFAVDGSTFFDGDYVIKGVAGKLLWSLLRQFQSEGRTDFTNREVRLDATLDLPDFRDNFESRLILLKRRLDEREALVRIDKTGRGRFRLDVDATLRLEAVDA